MSLPQLKMIVAMTLKHGIGKEGKIPWHYPADLKRFRQLTTGCPIIMGRSTWESLPNKPLPNRLNIVLTKSPRSIRPLQPGLAVASTIKQAIRLSMKYIRKQGNSKSIPIWIIGGQQVYESFINHPSLTSIDCTIVPDDVECDTFFPEIPDTFELSFGTMLGGLHHEVYVRR